MKKLKKIKNVFKFYIRGTIRECTTPYAKNYKYESGLTKARGGQES